MSNTRSGAAAAEVGRRSPGAGGPPKDQVSDLEPLGAQLTEMLSDQLHTGPNAPLATVK